jgi:hypothetical protein
MHAPLIRIVALALTVAALGASPASAASDQEKFEKLWNKMLVSTSDFRPRVACVCLATNEVGVLSAPHVSVPPYLAYCTTPTFDADGAISSLTNCGEFTVLKP